MRLLVAAALAALLVLIAVLVLPPLGSKWEWAATLTYVLIGPGVYVCRWFLSPNFATPAARLWIIAAVNWVLYWPAMLFLVKLAPDWRRILRSISFHHVLMALAAGAALSFLSYRLNIVSPKIFGILTTPASWVLWLISLAPPSEWRLRRTDFLRLIAGWLAYAVIAFLALFRLMWRIDSDRSI